MSAPPDSASRARWGWLPSAGLALLYHGVAHDRLAGAMVTLAGLTLIVWRGLRLDRGGRGWILALLAGMALGALQLPLSEPPSGPIGPLPLSLLTGALLGLLVWFLISEQPLWLGVSQWVLLALSSHVRVNGLLWVVLWAFIAATLVQGGLGTGLGRVFATRGGWRAGLVSLGALAVALGASRGLAPRIRALEEPFLAWLQNLMFDPRQVIRSSPTRDITLLSRGRMELSPRPVLDLSHSPSRLRSQVMDEFDGTSWATSSPLRQARRPLEPAVKNRGAGSRLDFVLLDDTLDHVPAPAGTSAGFGFNATIDGGGVLTGIGRVRDGSLWYDPQELLPTEAPPDATSTRLSDRLRAELTSLLDEIVPQRSDPAQTARDLEAFFQREFEYSLETDLLTNANHQHPLTVLIRDRRPAWCVYFASAQAALLRCAGIPARVVGGFLVPEGGPLTGHVVVREQDAHAWVEAWIDSEQRWRMYDPTPAGSRTETLDPYQSNHWTARLGRELQSLARRLGLSLRNHPVKTLGQLIGLPALLVLIPLALWRWRVRRQQAVGAQRGALVLTVSDPLLTRARTEFVRSLVRWGVQPGPHETDADLLQRLAERPDAPHPRAREFVTRYQQARYQRLTGDDDLLRMAQF